jgi:molybdopterin-guanine dinucleotide biosynthesis protein A
MGRDKALISVSGRTLLAIALDQLRALHLSPDDTPRIAGSRPDLAAYAPIVEDIHPACGPLSGIEAALAASRAPLNLFVPVDLPLLPPEFLGWMLLRAATTGALVTYPRVNGLAQPLCAVYHRDLLAPITRSLAGGDYKVVRVLAAAASEIAGSAGYGQSIDTFDLESLAATYPELRTFSPAPLYRWFQNCNTPEDVTIIDAEAAPS